MAKSQNQSLKNPTKLFPLVVTERLDETKAFYTEKVGAKIAIDMEGYFSVRLGEGEDAPELCFMAPDGQHGKFSGGLIVSVPVTNADEKASALKGLEVELMSEPEDRPWGWRSFAAKDPSGVMLDFFHVVSANPMMGDAAG